MRAFVFPGQGAQKKGMGGELFEVFPELVEKADSVLGYSITELCLEDPKELLGQTKYTQPALYCVDALSYLKKKEEGESCDYVLGHSLGEYAALFAAGAFDFETGLELVKKRGQIMSQCSGGGMAAVIGLGADEVVDILKKERLEGIDIANYNTSKQIVISGLKEDIEKAQPIFEANGAMMYIPLKVSGAFHSRYMEESYQEFKKILEPLDFNELNIPVISNVTARPYTNDNIKDLLAEQIRSSVKWTESIEYVIEKGVTEFEEIGPGKVLKGLITRIQKEKESKL